MIQVYDLDIACDFAHDLGLEFSRSNPKWPLIMAGLLNMKQKQDESCDIINVWPWHLALPVT